MSTKRGKGRCLAPIFSKSSIRASSPLTDSLNYILDLPRPHPSIQPALGTPWTTSGPHLARILSKFFCTFWGPSASAEITPHLSNRDSSVLSSVPNVYIKKRHLSCVVVQFFWSRCGFPNSLSIISPLWVLGTRAALSPTLLLNSPLVGQWAGDICFHCLDQWSDVSYGRVSVPVGAPAVISC
jgi:hypothetical protein